jgi:inosine/xanthosine triphosphate pyrophosphatase family protein
MQTLLCVTGNKDKLAHGQHAFSKYVITLEQVVADIDEIQGEDPEVIIKHKAHSAYDLISKPLVVTDDSWTIPGLGGFPGPYMKSINHWFTPDDLIRLTRDLTDRSIYINQFVAYIDDREFVVFRHDISLRLMKESRGVYGPPIMKVVESDAIKGKSISEAYDAGAAPHRTEGTAWDQLAKWYADSRA